MEVAVLRRSLLAVLPLVVACRPPVHGDDTADHHGPPPDTSSPDTSSPDTSSPDTSESETDPPDETGVEQVGGTDETPYTHGDTAWFFDPTVIHAFEISIAEDSLRTLNRNPYDYVPTRFTSVDDGVTLEGVGLQLKGGSTFRNMNGKPSFKIKFDFTVDGQELHDERRINLHNMVYDPSFMAEMLSYRMYRMMGNPASRVGYATVTINGQPYGLYSITETIDEHFAKHWWKNDEGPLYESGVAYYPCDFDKPYCFELEESGDRDYTPEVEALCDAVMQQGEGWYEASQGLFDWENAVETLALEAGVAHWDGYSENINNYHLYFDPKAGRWSWIPWSTDLAFAWYPWSSGQCGNYMGEPWNYRNAKLARKCWGHEACRTELFAALLEVADVMESEDWSATIDDLKALLAPAVEADPRKEYGTADFERQTDCFKEWIAGRPAYLREFVESPGPG